MNLRRPVMSKAKLGVKGPTNGFKPFLSALTPSGSRRPGRTLRRKFARWRHDRRRRFGSRNRDALLSRTDVARQLGLERSTYDREGARLTGRDMSEAATSRHRRAWQRFPWPGGPSWRGSHTRSSDRCSGALVSIFTNCHIPRTTRPDGLGRGELRVEPVGPRRTPCCPPTPPAGRHGVTAFRLWEVGRCGCSRSRPRTRRLTARKAPRRKSPRAPSPLVSAQGGDAWAADPRAAPTHRAPCSRREAPKGLRSTPCPALRRAVSSCLFDARSAV